MTIMKRLVKICFLPITIIGIASVCCQKEESKEYPAGTFQVSSPEIKADSLLPIKYTCDGESATLPLEWTGYPDDTRCFVLIMHHEASPEDIHWYWLLYNIPASVNSLEENITGIGILGTNSVNDRLEYAPPCSQGPGIKKYTYTVYALSENVTITVDPSEVDRAALLEAIEGITIASGHMNVYYERVTN